MLLLEIVIKILIIFDIKIIDNLNLKDKRSRKKLIFLMIKKLCNDRNKSFLICHIFNYNDDRI